MAVSHSKSSRVLINKNHLSSDIKSWKVNSSRGLGETTALLDEGTRGIPGLFSGSVSIEGLFDSAAAKMYTTVKDTVGVDNDLHVTVWPNGGAVGNPAFFAKCDTDTFEVESSVSDTNSMQFEGAADEMVDMGFSHHDLGAETATGNVASVDNLASSLNGGAAQLHVTAASGTTPSLTVKIQHSTDDSVWVDLITFTAATLATYEHKTVAAGTTVNRYLRATHTISGTTPSFTYGVSFARR